MSVCSTPEAIEYLDSTIVSIKTSQYTAILEDRGIILEDFKDDGIDHLIRLPDEVPYKQELLRSEVESLDTAALKEFLDIPMSQYLSIQFDELFQDTRYYGHPKFFLSVFMGSPCLYIKTLSEPCGEIIIVKNQDYGDISKYLYWYQKHGQDREEALSSLSCRVNLDFLSPDEIVELIEVYGENGDLESSTTDCAGYEQFVFIEKMENSLKKFLSENISTMREYRITLGELPALHEEYANQESYELMLHALDNKILNTWWKDESSVKRFPQIDPECINQDYTRLDLF